MTQTPLSDLFAPDKPLADADTLIEAFRHAEVGVFANGAPAGTTGEATSTAAQPLGLRNTVSPDGRSMILVFADPNAFAENFGPQFNATMRGEDVFRVVAANLECDGIRLNSATHEVSLILERSYIIVALE